MLGINELDIFFFKKLTEMCQVFRVIFFPYTLFFFSRKWSLGVISATESILHVAVLVAPSYLMNKCAVN